jgi:hypothetical protein
MLENLVSQDALDATQRTQDARGDLEGSLFRRYQAGRTDAGAQEGVAE